MTIKIVNVQLIISRRKSTKFVYYTHCVVVDNNTRYLTKIMGIP